MKKSSLLAPILGIVVIGILFQLALVHVYRIDTPQKAAVEFLTKYYKLDASMADRLCAESKSGEEADPVAMYIEKVTNQAQKRGFGLNYMKYRLFDIETSSVKSGDNSFKVHITAEKDRAPRAAFPFVARIFELSKVEKIDKELTLKKEDNKWRVCDFEFAS